MTFIVTGSGLRRLAATGALDTTYGLDNMPWGPVMARLASDDRILVLEGGTNRITRFWQ